MTDRDALVRAICEFPNDDTPRLIYADFLEENGEAERAALFAPKSKLPEFPHGSPLPSTAGIARPNGTTRASRFAIHFPNCRPEWVSSGIRRRFTAGSAGE